VSAWQVFEIAIHGVSRRFAEREFASNHDVYVVCCCSGWSRNQLLGEDLDPVKSNRIAGALQ